MWYNNFKRKQLEINNYARAATPGADILDTLLETGNEEVPNLKFLPILRVKPGENVFELFKFIGQSKLLFGTLLELI